MLKYTCKYWMILAPLVRRSLKKHCGRTFAKVTMQRAKTEYKAMLSRMDDIGADNPMASNVYMCFVFLAAYRAAKGRITVSGLRTVSHEVLAWKPTVINQNYKSKTINTSEYTLELYFSVSLNPTLRYKAIAFVLVDKESRNIFV